MIARAIEDARLFCRHLLPRRHEDELVLIRRFGIEFKGLLAHSNARSARQDVIIVIHHLFPWTAINHSLITLDTRSLFSLVGCDRDGAELDTFDDPVGL